MKPALAQRLRPDKALTQRMNALEAQVRDLRLANERNAQMQRRVAELVDLVEQVLLPTGDTAQDEALRARLADYRRHP
jgi:hypothetical protein